MLEAKEGKEEEVTTSGLSMSVPAKAGCTIWTGNGSEFGGIKEESTVDVAVVTLPGSNALVGVIDSEDKDVTVVTVPVIALGSDIILVNVPYKDVTLVTAPGNVTTSVGIPGGDITLVTVP